MDGESVVKRERKRRERGEDDFFLWAKGHWG